MLPIINKVLRKDKQKKGKCPIVLQVYFNKQRKQIFTGLFIEADNWDAKEQRPIAKYRDADYFNRLLQNKYEEIEQQYLKQSLTTGSVNIKATSKQSRLNYSDYATKFYSSKSNKASQHYINRCISEIEAFTKFAGEQSLQSITPQLLKEYEDHLFSLGRKRNTINGIFKRLKEPFTQAVRERVADNSPFNLFRSVTYKQTKRDFLTMEEIHLIEKTELPKELDYIRNWFLLSCYTGLRFTDAQKFNKSKIVTNKGIKRIIIGTTKTGEPVSIKLTENVKSIIDKLEKPLPSNRHTNQMLKLIGKAAKIEQELNYHISRHSAAVNMASAGLSIEVVGRILGHTSIRTTAIYYKITDSKLDEAMDKFNDFTK